MQVDLKKTISDSLQGAVFLLLVVSSLAGLAWGTVNFFYLQQFPETTSLIALARTLKSSGETGILYPAFLLIVITASLDMPIRFYAPIFIAQLILAFVSWYVFALNVEKASGKAGGSKAARAVFAFLVITNPFAMQCHLAVLEYSFASSFLCLLVSFYIRFSSEWKKSEGDIPADRAMIDISVISLFWLLLSLTRREFILIGAVPVLALAIRIASVYFSKDKKESVKRSAPHIALTVVFAVIIILADSLFASGEKVSASAFAKRTLFYRVAWSSYFYDPDSLPAELSDPVSDQALYMAMNDPGSIRYGYTDELVESLGSEDATDRMYDFFVYAFRDNKKVIIGETVLDLIGYVFPPARTEYILEGKDLPGYAVGNYEIMGRTTPLITKYYLRLFSIALLFMLLISAVITVRDKEKRSGFKIYAMPLVLILISSAVYTSYGCAVWDHRKALFATCMLVCFVLRTVMNTGADRK